MFKLTTQNWVVCFTLAMKYHTMNMNKFVNYFSYGTHKSSITLISGYFRYYSEKRKRHNCCVLSWIDCAVAYFVQILILAQVIPFGAIFAQHLHFWWNTKNSNELNSFYSTFRHWYSQTLSKCKFLHACEYCTLNMMPK